MASLSKEEAIEKYGKVPLLFSSYYKYSFVFRGKAEDGAQIYVSVGGNGDDIYRFDVSRDSPMYLADGYYAKITNPEGQEIANWYDIY